MPIYEYECEQCHCLFERKQRYDEEPVAMCQCGGRSRRVLRSVPIIFKGSGFYQTDYRSRSYKDAAKKEKSEGETKSAKHGGETASASSDKKSTATKKE